MATFRPSGISVFLRQDLTEGSGRSGTTLNIDPIITKSGARVAMSDIGDICFAKLDQGTDSEEIISFTGITDNTSTYQLTGCVWGYNFHNLTNGVAGNQKRHVSGGTFIITNDDHFLTTQYLNTDGDQTLSGVKTFTSFPVGPSEAPTTDYQMANKKYADDLAIAGAPDANYTIKGIVEIATSAESKAGVDNGSTEAYLSVVPSDIASNVQDASYSYATDTSEDDAYAITITPAISAYVTGQVFYFKANAANTGACTLNVNAKGAKAILKNVDEALETGDIKVGAIITVIYDGAQFQMQTQQSSMPSTAILSEMDTFFTNTDITGAQAETLTDGSDASSLHTHTYPTGIGGNLAATTYTYQATWSHHTGESIWTYTSTTSTNNSSGSIELAGTDNNWVAYSSMPGTGSDIIAQFDSGKDVTIEFRMRLISSGSTDTHVGIGQTLYGAYNTTNSAITFSIDGSDSNKLYAHNSNGSSTTNTDVSSGITVTNWNLYKFVYTNGTDIKFYINGSLVATHTTNLPIAAEDIRLGSGGSASGGNLQISTFTVTQEM